MNSILIDEIRIDGFRGLKNFRMKLEETTVLTGMNNAGKTSVLRALQLALGSRTFLTIDDLHIEESSKATNIIIDIKIVPTDENGIAKSFDNNWESNFTTDNTQVDLGGNSFVPLRTIFAYNTEKGDFEKKQFILKEWERDNGVWQEIAVTKTNFPSDILPFYYIEAQRDIVDDIRNKTSFLGKLLSQVANNYSPEDIQNIEKLIEELNNEAIAKSNILSLIQEALSAIDTTINNKSSKVSITPFVKKIRDLTKSVSIQYGEEDPFSMDYHGMGTRSWSSLLTFKAFLEQIKKIMEANEQVYYPIVAIEEPEAHLHPNAQKKLYSQIKSIYGQKIISTHSPYIAACAELSELRNLYKEDKITKVGNLRIEKGTDDERNIKQKVINTRGELFFAKALVFFEGETEELALPIIAEKFFNQPAIELGINFIGVGGYGQYLPFIKFATEMNIPWYIFSDGEDSAKNSIFNAIKKIKEINVIELDKEQNVFIIPNKGDFERYIMSLDYLLDDIKKYLKEDTIIRFPNENQRECELKKIDNLSANEILSKAKGDKPRYALVFANAIINSDKPLPPLMKELFKKIKKDLF